LNNLEKIVTDKPIAGPAGIGHTRWATHGEPSARNAHPHVGRTGKVVVVHNGIVENFIELREELSKDGVLFNSETDTEVIVHLIERYLSSNDDLTTSVRRSLSHLKGAHGVVVLSTQEPDKIIAARIGNAGGVVIGFGKNEMYVASDLPAILEHTRQVTFLESRQIGTISTHKLNVQTLEGMPVDYDVHALFPGTLSPPKRVNIDISWKRKFMNRCAH